MINKEIIYRNGGIERDFINKQIPQYSHMQVNVNCLIPAALLQGLPNYAVMLAMEFKADDAEDYEQRPSLVMFTGKALTIDGIDYIKFMALLPSNYTDKVGRLKLTPYIQTTTDVEVTQENPDTHEEETITRTITAIQQTFTEGYLIVVKASKDAGDGSLEDPEVLTQLLALINSKRIFYVNEYREAAYGALLWHIWNDYNPALTIYKGAIIMVKYDKFQDTPEGPYKKKTNVYFNCQVTTGESSEDYILMLDVETREMTKYYNIERTGTEGAYNYSYQEEKVTYNKAAIDALIQDLWDAKVDKTTEINGHALSGNVDLTKGDVGLGNVVNYGVESTPTASGDQLYITSKAVYDALQTIYGIISGMATEEQITTINNRLTAIESLLGDGTDDDNIINTLYEVVQTLSGLGEDANILSMINSKVSQSDFDTLNSQINGTNGIATKVSFLYDSNANAYAEIKAQSGTIDILTTDWVANSDANYPYKWELSNGYLVGASYVSVVFDKDSDTSMLSASVGIDDENGKIILYASELPSATISIQLIAIFNSVNAYVLYNQTLVSQVATNTSAISEINNTKLPYLAKNLSAYFGDGVEKTLRITQIANSNGESQTIAVEKLITGASGNENRGKITINSNEIIISRQLIDYASPSNEKSYEIRLNDTDGFKVNLGGKNNGTPYCHYLTFDANGDLKIDGNAVGGGGSQLYQHDIKIYCNPTDENGTFYFSLVCNKSTALTFSDLISLIGTSVAISGKYTRSSTKYICCRLEKVNATTMNVHYTKIDSDNYSVFTNGNNMTITDTIRPL